MKVARAAGAILLVASSLVGAVIACGGSSGNGDSARFPYSGPTCTGPEYSSACWACTESNCSPGCITADCNDYLSCFCACDAGDGHCAGGCDPKLSQACVACVNRVGTCQLQRCPSGCLGTGSASGG